jgi:hypothetical protein
VTVLQHKRTFDAGLARFRQLGKHDRFFALHAGVEVVSYALKAARKRILRAMGRSQDA